VIKCRGSCLCLLDASATLSGIKREWYICIFYILMIILPNSLARSFREGTGQEYPKAASVYEEFVESARSERSV
jgi:hypothetical protein